MIRAIRRAARGPGRSRMHLLRYHGVLGPMASWREQVVSRAPRVAAADGAAGMAGGGGAGTGAVPGPPAYAPAWGGRIARGTTRGPN